MACDNDVVQEGAMIWLLAFLMKKTASAALTTRLSLKDRLSHNSIKESMIKSYLKVLNQLLQTYATDDVIAEADTNTVRFALHQTDKYVSITMCLCPVEEDWALHIYVIW